MEQKKENRILSLLKRNRFHLIAFAIPVAAMIVIYYLRGVYPFGDQIYLRSDCYHQYAPFHMELLRKLQSGGSLLYSWDIGMGVNFISLIAYYLASPFNIILFFVPAGMMTEIVGVYLIGKIGLCGFTCSYYLGKRFRTVSPATTAFAVFYALSAYMAAFNWNIMWLDCLWLLPLIVYGLEKLVHENKGFMYCITLGIAIISNYYIGIMLCIYCVLYFLVLLLSSPERMKFKDYAVRFVKFGFYSLLAGGLAAFLILPEYFTLLLSASADSSFPESLYRYFSVFDMLSRSVMNVETAVFSAHDPNIYCTVGAFLFIPLYAICKKIPVKERVLRISLAVLLLLSFNLNIPNYIWHGLHFPNSLPARESFLYIFLIISMCFEAFHHLEDFSNREIVACMSGALAVMLILEQLYVGTSYDFTSIYYSAVFIVLYAVICICIKNPKYLTSLLVWLFLMVSTCEAVINSEETTLVSTTTRDYYIGDNDDISSLLAEAEKESDTLFYRVEKYKRRTKNDAAWSGYRGVSIFSSTTNAGISAFLEDLGMEYSYNAYSYYGNTPLTESLLCVKYLLSNTELEETALRRLCASTDDYYIYENIYTLPLGFMIPEELTDDWIEESSNPFYVQNLFCGLSTGCYNLFSALNTENFGSYCYVYGAEGGSDAYFCMQSECESVSATTYDESKNVMSTQSFSDLDEGQICYLGYIPEGGYCVIKSTDDEHSSVTIYADQFSEEVYLEMYETLCNEGLVISEFTDTMIKGEVTALADGYMYTSIPYEEGWTVTVDGAVVETSAFQDAFVTFPVEAGTHTIEFSYFPKGFRTGILLSLISLFLLLATIPGRIVLRRLRQNAEHRKAMMELSALVSEGTDAPGLPDTE